MSEAGRAMQFAIEANQKRLDKSLARVEAAVAKTTKKIDAMGQQAFAKTEAAASKAANGISRSFAGIGKGIAAGLAGYLTAQGAQQLFTRIQTALDHFDDLGDAAARLGTSAKFLVQWGAALNAAGGDMEAFNTSIEEFQGKIGAVIGNIGKTKATQSALSALGISRADIAAAGDLEQKLLLIADGLAQVGDRATRAAIADKLGLRPLLPLLEQGAAGVQKLAGQFDGLGNAAQQGVDATGDLADKMKVLQAELQIREDNLFVQLGPYLANFYSWLTNILSLIDSPSGRVLFGSSYAANFGLQGALATLLPERADLIAKYEQQLKDLKAKRDDALRDNQGLERSGLAWLLGSSVEEIDAEIAHVSENLRKLKVEQAMSGGRSGSTVVTPPVLGKPTLLGPTEEDLKNAKKAGDEAQRISDIYEKLGADIHEIFRNDLADRTNALLSGGDAQATPVLDAISAAAEEQKQAFTDAMVYAFQSGDLKGAALSFIGFFTNRMYRDLANSIYDALFDGTGKFGGGGGGGLFGSLIGALTGVFGGGGSGLAAGFSQGFGARASGGPVSANQPYMVGERGPELFVPRTGGTIMANNRMGGTTMNVSIVNPTRDVLPAVLAKVDELGRAVSADRVNFRRNVQTVVNDGSRRNQVVG